MLRSMTGFGKICGELPTKKIIIEIKSVNSKQIDLNTKIASYYKEKEMDIRSELSRLLERGKIDFMLTVDNNETEKNGSVNEAVFKNHFQQFSQLSKSLNVNISEAELFVSVMRFPFIFQTENNAIDENEWKAILSFVNQAIEELNKFREQEGEALQNDISSRINLILSYLSEIQPYENQRIENIKIKIRDNFKQYFPDSLVDQNRFEQELIYYTERLDITEEKVRLKNHCDYFLDTLKEDSAGKKLGFISQEIGREINTIGSKANEVNIQKIVVKMKDELEKIKEQLMNIL